MAAVNFSLDGLVTKCHNLSKRGAILADSNICETIGREIQALLDYELISVPSGQKNREAKQALEDELFQRKLGRDTVLVAVGGGATTDLVGFLAATYMRGVPLILIPTTLLAMVDAAIGGKTGLDTPFGKNLIGAFYPAKALFIETRFLNTLSEREKTNGLSEILKYGLIWNPQIWQMELSPSIAASIECKLQIVEKDPQENGLRRILNYGHTVGHALELLLSLPHGEAVALGCVAESYLSHICGYLNQEEFEKIRRHIAVRFPRFDPITFKNAMLLDKKAKGGVPRFVMIDRIGHCLAFDGEYCRPVEEKMLDQMIAWMHGQSHH